jgi:hypothetical protein
MPVALLALAPAIGFAPIARPRFLIGSDLDCDLVDRSPGVAPYHARVRLLRGEYVLVAMPGCSLWVGGERCPLLTLRDGDEVALAPEGTTWRFRSRVEGSFWPPEYSVGEAWIHHPAFEEGQHAPQDLDWARAAEVGGVPIEDERGLLRVLDVGGISDGRQANAHLRLLAALGGAAHPNLAPVIDGGVVRIGQELRRWLCVRRREAPVSVAGLLTQGALRPTQALLILRDLARILAHLHQRGIVLRTLRLEAVTLGLAGEVQWEDYAHAYSLEGTELAPRELPAGVEALAATAGISKERDLPTSADDVYQLGLVAEALLSARPIYQPGDVAAPTRPGAEGAEGGAREAVWPAVHACRAEDPTHRPDAASLVTFLDGVIERTPEQAPDPKAGS